MGALTGPAAATVAFAAALSIAPALGGSIGVRTIAAALVVAALSVVYGRAIARWLALPADAEWHGGFVVVAGFGAVTVVHLLATSVLGVDARIALVVDVLGAVAAARLTLAEARRTAHRLPAGRSATR